MHKLIVPFLLLSIVLASCTRWNIEKDTPKCVKDKIVDFKRSEKCTDLKVEEYIFQENTVYVFVIGQCGGDMQSEVIDPECNILGSLGGITGNWEINEESFENAVFVKNIWEK